MGHLAYLEPDDELTTAASRIRETTGDRVGLVLPFNSRVATSRINFRLLAREAQAAGRIMDVIAPDASARALAVSAGLRAFASVGEYEAALGGLTGPGATPGWTDDPAPVRGGVQAKPLAAQGRTREPAVRPLRDERGREPRVVRGNRRLVSPALMLVILIVTVLLGMGGAAGAMLLPSASIAVTAKAEDVPALTLKVTADPTQAQPDAASLRIPALLVELPVQVSGDYPATGKKVTETKATGSVVFESINTVFPVSVPQGTRVSTLDGLVFATAAAVIVPRATVSGSTIKRGTAAARITAVKAGPRAMWHPGRSRRCLARLLPSRSPSRTRSEPAGARTQRPSRLRRPMLTRRSRTSTPA